jgi:predicted transcriptional regulator
LRHRILPDIEVILEMLKTRTQQDIAKEYGVSGAAVSKKLRSCKPIPESFNALTEKKQRFVIEKVSGKNNTQAALTAFECTTSKSAKAIGAELMKDPKVLTAMQDVMEQEGLTDRHLAKRLKHWVDSRDGNHSLRATDISLKVKGAYPTEKQSSPTEIRNFTQIIIQANNLITETEDDDDNHTGVSRSD